MGEDRVGEKMVRDFDKLGMGKGSAKIEVSQVYAPEESVSGDDGIK